MAYKKGGGNICMSAYSKRKGIFVSFIIAIVIWISSYFILVQFQENQKKEADSAFILKTSQINPITDFNENVPKEVGIEEVVENQYKENSWRIFIPKINLDAPILEGTSKEILRRGVGHFTATSRWDGNVVLAAHNRGYKYNFFQEIKRLEIGDLVEYQTEQGLRTYEVIGKKQIKETDLSCLENTKENQLTLLTCLENMPEYRLCIQAKEIN